MLGIKPVETKPMEATWIPMQTWLQKKDSYLDPTRYRQLVGNLNYLSLDSD